MPASAAAASTGVDPRNAALRRAGRPRPARRQERSPEPGGSSPSALSSCGVPPSPLRLPVGVRRLMRPAQSFRPASGDPAWCRLLGTPLTASAPRGVAVGRLSPRPPARRRLPRRRRVRRRLGGGPAPRGVAARQRQAGRAWHRGPGGSGARRRGCPDRRPGQRRRWLRRCGGGVSSGPSRFQLNPAEVRRGEVLRRAVARTPARRTYARSSMASRRRTRRPAVRRAC